VVHSFRSFFSFFSFTVNKDVVSFCKETNLLIIKHYAGQVNSRFLLFRHSFFSMLHTFSHRKKNFRWNLRNMHTVTFEKERLMFSVINSNLQKLPKNQKLVIKKL